MVLHAAAPFVFFLASGVLGADRFEPESCFPKDCFFYASINVGALRKGLAATPVGKVLTHPGVLRALGRLPDMLRSKVAEGTEGFQKVTGKTPLEFLELFTGEVALTMSGLDLRSGPHMTFAVELGARRKDILETVDRIEKTANEELSRFGGGPTAQKSEMKGFDVTTWSMQFGPSLQYGVLGTHFVLVMGGGMEAVIDRLKARGDEERDALRFNPTFARSKVGTSGFSPALTLFYNWEGTRKTMDLLMGEIPMADEMNRAFAAVGLDKLASGTYKVGFRDGDFEMKLLLDSPGGWSGILGLIVECLSPLEDPSALAKLPAGALEASGLSVSVGRLVRGVLEKAREGFPSSVGQIDAFVSGVEAATGLSVADDLYKLPKISLAWVNVPPPGGGISPDVVLVARTSQLEPYIVLLSKFLKHIGAEVEPLQVEGRDIAFVSVGDIYTRLGITDLLGPRPKADLLPFLALEPAVNVAFAAVDDDWTVVTCSPQAMARYFSHYAKGAKASEDEALAALIKKEIGTDAAFAVYRGGRYFVPMYNTLVGIAIQAAPYMEKELKAFDVNLTRLPPGESFAAEFRDGFAVIRSTKESLLVHSHRVLSNLLFSPSVVHTLLAYGVGAGLKKAGIQAAAPKGPEDRLKELGAVLKAYAAASGGGAYPYSPEGSLKALQVLLDEDQVDDAERFVSLLVRPGGAEKPAKLDPSTDSYALTPENVSYEFVPWKQGPKDNPGRMLLYEKGPRDGKRQVLFVDLSVKTLGEDEFAALLEDQTKKYGRK